MRVCVQGLWHLGTVTAAGLASLGHYVVGLDFDTKTIEQLGRAVPPVFEPGLADLLRQGIDAGNLRFTADAEMALRDVEVHWVAYDTPVDADDKADVDYVLSQIELAMVYLPPGVTVLVSSQLPVGSVRRLEEAYARRSADRGIGFCCAPENLRLGKALEVFLRPDRIVVGTRLQRDRDRLSGLLGSITDEIEWMSVESAEMTKHAINAFLATSVAFANEIASLSELLGADAKEVERGLKSESRIGPKAYLSPGAAFAGGTLARDVAFLNRLGGEMGLQTPLLSAIRSSNDEHKNWIRRRLKVLFPDLADATIAVWGLTYKPGTDTLRGSLAVDLCEWLLEQGALVAVHDPAVKDLPSAWRERVVRSGMPLDTLAGARALVVSTEWPEYKAVPGVEIARAAPGITVFDANRFLNGLSAIPGLTYVAVGTSAARRSDEETRA